MFVRANKATIPCEEVSVALRKGEHLNEPFSKINPFKRVPVIEHDNFVLTESVAIFRYLCRTFPVADHWYPKDSQKMARVDEFMAWQHTTLRSFGAMYFRTKVILPLMTGEPVNEAQAEFFRTNLITVLEQIDTIWLKDRPFMAGDEVSIADLLAVTELEQPGMAGFDVRKGHPKIIEYMDRVRDRLNPHYDEAHDIVRKAEKRLVGKL
jgi:glutathione S-transferase